ncbi:MAG: hypothetical protein Q7Q71_07780 [Verrucomicrobiota bacterium JB023]|nr:hypothetical protein [Verrucomicrobiota bacterium JB023]
MNKSELLQAVLREVREERLRLSTALEESRSAATDPDSKAESKYDTRSLEVSYLAAGQAKQLKDLEQSVRILESLEPRSFEGYEPIELGALVELEVEEAVWKKYYLLPAGGGVTVAFDGHEVTTLAPGSPLCEKLIGLRIGDQVGEAMSVTEVS